MTLLRRLLMGESGQVLPAVLVSLALGTVLIVPCISYANASLRSTLTQQESIRGTYAAEAGVEDIIWSLKNGSQLRTALPLNPNGMQVSMSTLERGNYTLWAGEWVTATGHYTWMLVSGNYTWDAGANAYKFTVTVTWNAESGTTIHLSEVGARLPVGYTYQVGSAALFGDNLSLGEPTYTVGGDGAHMVRWDFPTPRPTLRQTEPTRTQVFYMTGQQQLINDYSWAIAERQDIGTVGTLSGTFYVVTATATRPADGRVTARIVANVMMSEGVPYVTSWRIYPQ